MIDPIVQLTGLVVATVAANWVASRLRIPSILAACLVSDSWSGPCSASSIRTVSSGSLLTPLVALAVGVILFEGGLEPAHSGGRGPSAGHLVARHRRGDHHVGRRIGRHLSTSPTYRWGSLAPRGVDSRRLGADRGGADVAECPPDPRRVVGSQVGEHLHRPDRRHGGGTHLRRLAGRLIRGRTE